MSFCGVGVVFLILFKGVLLIRGNTGDNIRGDWTCVVCSGCGLEFLLSILEGLFSRKLWVIHNNSSNHNFINNLFPW